ncbi:RNA polymerase sigma factor SigJ [Actinoplanes aureus]|uniref:RNA polymerase sigma factor SigJ n=1 Tax=Actinoplanes aureus TaxID=2792083 RepID=A0A931C6T6_9ACTN|nr:RNA polymerase sigma factor SigJ [Actinoplanes aureus]MBG0564489.1 RNA polymerase sigma factor SigJ [Actinoplanes aureus]
MTAAFTEHRGLLFAVAYRMLGSVTEAEDVVQEAWLRWNRVDPGTVADAEGYLVRVTIRLAIDQLRSARVRREAYVGPWLPEPLLTRPDVAEDVVRAESVSTALLLILETLTPLERAVFVLHEAFGYAYGEIGSLLGRAEPAVRQLARRARSAVEARERRYDSDPATRRVVAERFRAACESGDVAALMAVLAPDVTMLSDGGGTTGAPRKPIRERALVARALLVLSRQRPAGSVIRPAEINGGPGLVVMAGPAPVLAMTLHVFDGMVRTLHVVSNPAKLTGVV